MKNICPDDLLTTWVKYQNKLQLSPTPRISCKAYLHLQSSTNLQLGSILIKFIFVMTHSKQLLFK